MKTWYAALIGVSAFFLGFAFNKALAYDEVGIAVEDEVELEYQTDSLSGLTTRDHVIEDDDFHNSHLVLVSTMDGKITALDVNAGGEVAWTVDADAAPLLSGTFSTHQKVMQAGELPFTLVPSLDGSLFMLEIDKGLLHPVPLTADISRMINDFAVTGGSLNSKTGVDPVTGKVRYRCTAGKCEQSVSTPNLARTLVITRNTQTARAADPLTGSEKWNLSVGEYVVQLFESDGTVQNLYTKTPTRVNFRLKPPDGVVSAFICGHHLWEQHLESPIARVWQIANGQLQEISLFDSNNIEALSSFGQGCEGNTIPRFETPFYLGFFNSEPYIIPSEKVRAQKYLPRFASSNSELDLQSHLFLHDLVIVNAFKRKYQNRIREIGMATDAPKRLSFVENCPVDEAVLVPGSLEVERHEQRNDDEIYGGWYIFTPIVNPQHMLVDSSQPKSNVRGTAKEQCSVKAGFVKKIREQLSVSELVSGWWRLGAIGFGLLFLSAGCVIRTKFWRSRSGEDLGLNMNTDSSSVALVSKSNGDSSNRSSSSLTPQLTPSDPFVSKFFEDFIPQKCLGRGGYGVVFNCKHRLDDRNYAVKRITVSNTVPAIERVKREARAMAKLDHPGIIRYFHTWIEKPPLGWQQAMDKQILEKIRSGAGTASVSFIQTSEGESQLKSDALLVGQGDSIASFLSKKVVRPLNGNPIAKTEGPEELNVSAGVSATGSWALTGSTAENDRNTSSSDSNFSAEEGIAVARKAHESVSETSSVVFAEGTESIKKEPSDAKKSSSGPLEPPLVLVANDTDLRTCKKAKNYIYLYIQMELCQELTLHNWLLNNRTRADRELSQMRNWFTQLVCAIDYIHEQGLIHRDLKPQNIFFSADGLETLKIGDLGLATNFDVVEGTSKGVQEVNANRHTGNVGTKLYMSPEQLKGQPYNQKVDVFSLGLIFAEMLIPFQTVMERHESLTALQKGSLPEHHLKEMPDERAFILWLTIEDPKRRPTCREVMQCEYLAEEVRFVGTQFRVDRSHPFNNNRLPSVSKANV